MNTLNLDQFRSQLARRVKSLAGQRLLHDRLSLAILVPSLVINLATLVLLAVKIHPSSVAVPVRYSSLTGFEGLGQWYQIYYLGLFGLLVTGVNGFLAIVSFGRSRITSFFLLAGAFVVALFCLVIGAAFAAIV